jgi:bifunctional non-homologous end joining protein LigD
MPLVWDEVDLSLDPRTFTIRTAVDRMEKVGVDPMLPVLTESPDLAAVLGKLAERMKA